MTTSDGATTEEMTKERMIEGEGVTTRASRQRVKRRKTKTKAGSPPKIIIIKTKLGSRWDYGKPRRRTVLLKT